MMKIRNVVLSLAAATLILLTSCSGDDYLNAIPAESTALVSIDMAEAAGQVKGKMSANMLKAFFHVSDLSDCGIDLTSKIYLFESPEGNLGMAAKVKDEDDMAKWIDKLAKYGICSKVEERRGTRFTVVKQSWLVAFNDNAMLVMGPFIASAQPEMMRRMGKYLNADEGIKGTPIYDKLDSIDAPIAMVAQVSALPEKASTLLTLGVPKGADPSRVVFAAGMSVDNGCLKVEGKTFSYDKKLNNEMAKTKEAFRPVTGKYVQCISKDATAAILMNAEGGKLIDILHANKGLQAILAGVNTAIDMDNIIRSIDGDMALSIAGYDGDTPTIQLAAQLGKRDFLADVDYWKKSCPAGSKITDWRKDAYKYSGNATGYCFGVSEDNQFYSGSTEELADASIKKASATPLPESMQAAMKGQRICLVVSVASAMGGNEQAKIAQMLLTPLFGNINSILLTLGD